MTPEMQTPWASIVIPLYNSEGTIGPLCEEIVEVFSGKGGLQIVLVNDGSADGTHAVCQALAQRHPEIVIYVRLVRNFGEHNAVMAGLHYAAGEFTVIMDDDFQNAPDDALALVQAAEKDGQDVVYSWYAHREHHPLRLLGSWFNGTVANVMLDKPKDLYLSSFKCMRRWLVKEVIRYTGPSPYIDGLILRTTRSIGRLEVMHHAREKGKSGYTLRKLIRLWLNMFVNFSIVPLRASTVMGFVMVLAAICLSIYVLWEKLSGHAVPTGWTFLAIILMFFSGAQLVMLGVMGEYVGRLLLLGNATPQFVVRDRYGAGVSQQIPDDLFDRESKRVEIEG